MAKARTIDDIVNDIVTKKYKPLLKEAVEHVAKQAEEDIYNKAVNVLVKYYYGGYDPTSYERTQSLIQSIVPYSAVSLVGSGKKEMVECVVGVEYDANRLAAYVAQNGNYYGSDYWNIADSRWVIKNFLEGKHPRTDGSPYREQAQQSFELVDSTPMVTQKKGMYMNEPGDTGYGLTYYQHTIFPKAVMNYIMVKGSR